MKERTLPYFTGSPAVHRFTGCSPDVEPDDEAAGLSSTEVAINLGAGVTRTLNDNWAARADLRYFHSNDTAPNYRRLSGGLTLRIR